MRSMMKDIWIIVMSVVALAWMVYMGWGMYIILTRPLWVTVPVTQICQMDGKNCEWKWPTQNLGAGGVK